MQQEILLPEEQPMLQKSLLISIEPLIDMARTALNVNGSMMTGVITNKIVKIDEIASSAAPLNKT